MKNQLIKIASIALLVAAPTLLTLAQPNPGENSGSGTVGGGPIGGNAPIGSGLAILLLSGAAYAGNKAYNAQKQTEE